MKNHTSSPARLPKRQTAKPAQNGKGPAHPASDRIKLHTQIEAEVIGQFIRRAADKITADLEDATQDLRGLLMSTDEEDQLGLHELRRCYAELASAVSDLRITVFSTKVRGESGHSDE